MTNKFVTQTIKFVTRETLLYICGLRWRTWNCSRHYKRFFYASVCAGLFATVTLVQESRQPEHSQATNEDYHQGNQSGCIHISSPGLLTRLRSGRLLLWAESVLTGPSRRYQ